MGQGGITKYFEGSSLPATVWFRLYESKWIDSAGAVQIVEPNDAAYAPVKLTGDPIGVSVSGGNVTIHSPDVTFGPFAMITTILGMAVTDALERVLYWTEFPGGSKVLCGGDAVTIGGTVPPLPKPKPKLDLPPKKLAFNVSVQDEMSKALVKMASHVTGVKSYKSKHQGILHDQVIYDTEGYTYEKNGTKPVPFACTQCHCVFVCGTYPVTETLRETSCPKCFNKYVQLYDNSVVGSSFALSPEVNSSSQYNPVFIERFDHYEKSDLEVDWLGTPPPLDVTVRASQRGISGSKYTKLVIGQDVRVRTGNYTALGKVVGMQERGSWRVLWFHLNQRFVGMAATVLPSQFTAHHHLLSKKMGMKLSVKSKKTEMIEYFQIVIDGKGLVAFLNHYGFPDPIVQVTELLGGEPNSQPSVLNAQGIAIPLVEVFMHHYVMQHDSLGYAMETVFEKFGASVTKKHS